MTFRAVARCAVVGRAVSLIVLAAGLALAGCAKKSERVYFEGHYYPTKARAADRADRQSFTVSVRRAGQGLKGARAAGAHGGKAYCLKYYGTSDIAWTVGPDAPADAIGAGSGRLRLSGRCVLW